MTARSFGPDAPVRVAVVGLGMGWHHVPQFRRHPHCRVVAVCDADAERVRLATKELDIEHGFTSIDSLLDWGEGGERFHLASLALPNDLHAPVTVRFLEAGYHLLLEKPLALNAEEGRRIVDASRRRPAQKVAVHYNQRMSPEHQLIRKAFDSGELGRVYYIRTGWMRKKGIPLGAAGWFYRKERSGGGPLIDLGVHMLDSALYCCGFPRVLSVTGQTHRFFAERDLRGGEMDVEDFATAYLRCEGGLTIVLEVSWAGFHEHYQEAFMHVYGTEAGAHRRTFFDERWRATGTMRFSRRRGSGTSTETVDVMPEDVPGVQEDLVQSIIDDREPVCTVDQGLVVMEVLDAIYQSARAGHEVRLDGNPGPGGSPA